MTSVAHGNPRALDLGCDEEGGEVGDCPAPDSMRPRRAPFMEDVVRLTREGRERGSSFRGVPGIEIDDRTREERWGHHDWFTLCVELARRVDKLEARLAKVEKCGLCGFTREYLRKNGCMGSEHLDVSTPCDWIKE